MPEVAAQEPAGGGATVTGSVSRAPLVRGKVRDLFDAGGDRLLIVATDRISAFDVVLPNPVPGKGRVLTAFSLFWYGELRDLVPNHLITAQRRDFPEPFAEEAALSGRAMLVRRARVIPLECVARGYLAGSGWAQYREDRRVCGIELPDGLVESDRLPAPIFTPTTKAAAGHDLPLTPDQARDLVGAGLYERLRELTLGIYERVAARALARGSIVADTKLEFGFDLDDGELTLIDEVGTPDSSRLWPADRYIPGRPQPSFDKQFVRDWLDASGWDREPPPPELPAEVVETTAATYREAYERITSERFEAYERRMGVDEETLPVDRDRPGGEPG
ncbi:MAG: phosphoribosylaminoimidazolesuccinocarboxamide synthase [Actinomycetota bacterium]